MTTEPRMVNRRPHGTPLRQALTHAAGLAATLIVPVWVETAIRPSPNATEGRVMVALLALFVAPLATLGFLAGARTARKPRPAGQPARRLSVSALTGAGSAVILYGIVFLGQGLVGADLLYLLFTPLLAAVAARMVAGSDRSA